jgi:hypothetical protein
LGYKTYTWKVHKEAPCIAILNKQNVILFSFTKSENRRAKQILPGGIGTREGKGCRKGCRKVNMLSILCTNFCKWKNETS